MVINVLSVGKHHVNVPFKKNLIVTDDVLVDATTTTGGVDVDTRNT